jgi:tRNA dimethylallyltransferase
MTRPGASGAKPKVLMITGPTAVGKTSLSIQVAKALGGHVISADSMQIYRWMELGTAQPTIAEMQGIPHYFMSIIRPDEDYSAAEFGSDASCCIRWLLSRGLVPIVAGGARLYLRALTHGMFPGAPKDAQVRRRLLALAEAEGAQALHTRLAGIDPETAARLAPTDLKRVVRAIEVYETTGKPISSWQTQSPAGSPFEFIKVILTASRESIYEAIATRTRRMFEMGFLDEVQRLLDMGYRDDIERIKANGYREAAAHLRGEIPESEAYEKMDRATRHNAKYQLMWTRQERDWHVIDVEGVALPETAARIVSLYRAQSLD